MTGDRAATVTALALAAAVGVTAWVWRTGAVGGSDSACYALMAQVFADGQVQPTSPLALQAPWPDATRVAAPAGFLPSASTPGAAVPVCAPGYSLLVAPLVRVWGSGAVHVVPPVAAASLVWLAFVLARRVHSPWAGAGAAPSLPPIPIVWFQAVQPMNDIATGALWLAVGAAALAARPVTAGLLVGVGVLVRPNLAPAGAVALLVCVWMAARPFTGRWRSRALRAGAIAGVAALPGVVAALALNAALYGSPFTSGYGSLEALFAVAHVPVNLAQYGRTWIASGSPLVLLAMAAPWLVERERRADTWALGLLAGALSVVYLAYRPFPEWWYLRFLLPAVVLSLVLASSAVFALARRVVPSAAVPLALVAVAAAAAWAVRTGEARDALGLQRLERDSRSPLLSWPERRPRTPWRSPCGRAGGCASGRGARCGLGRARPRVARPRHRVAGSAGAVPAIVVEQWEEEGFRRRFATQRFGGLDWPPRYDVVRRVRVFLPEDRARYLAGALVPTTPVFPPRR